MKQANKDTRTSEEKTPSPPYPSANDSSLADRLRILVVDDNPTNRKLLKLLLEAEGHSVVEADNGVAALQVLEHSQIDAVISDILMPEMDGYRLSYEVRKSPKFSHVPFIVYTASYTLPADEKLALQFGVDKFIRKPATGDDILKNLYEVVATANDRERKDLEKPEEAEVMREYSQVLVRKLEQTIADLSDANRDLAERTRLAEFVATVSTAISQRAGLTEMLRRCCDAMVEHLGSAFARIWTLNEKEQVLELQASSGMYTHINGGHARIPVGQFKIGLIASEGKPHLTNTVIGDPRVNDQEWAKREGMIAFAGYPLMIADQLVGVMATFARKPFSQNTLDGMGSVAQSIAVGIQRQFTEGELRQSEERFRELAENINEIFYIAHPEGKQFYYISPAHEQITGQKCDAVYQNPHAWLESIHPDDRERIEEALRMDSARLDEEYRVLRPDGELRWLRSRSFPVKDEHGEVARVVGIATDITEQKQAEAKVNQNLNRIRALHEIDLAITSTLDLPTVLKVLLEKMEVFFSYPTVTTVRLLNQKTGELEALACHNIDKVEWQRSFSGAPGLRARRVLDTKAPLMVRNVATDRDSASLSLYRDNGLVSYVGLPLVARNEALGVLNVYTREEREFGAEEIEFLMTLAGQAAIAIHNAQLHEQTQQHLKRIEGVSEINNAIASTLSLNNVLDILLEKIELISPFAVACGVRLFDLATGNMVPLAARHIPFEEWRQEVANAKGRLTKLLIETKKPVAILNMHSDSRTSMHNFARRHGLVSYLGVPLIVRDKFIGNLVIYTKQEHAFSAEEIEFFTNLGSQAAIAIHNARLYEETERRRREAEELARVARSLTETLDMTVVGERIVTSVRKLFAVQGSTLRLREANGSLRLLASSGEVFSQTSAGDAVPSGAGLMSRALTEGRPVWSSDTLNDPEVVLTDEMRDYQIRSGNRSMIAVPLRAHEKLIGALTLSDRTGRIYADSEVALVQTFADQAALAMENARLYEETHRSRKELETTNQYLERSLQQLGGLYTAMAPLTGSESFVEMIQGIIARLMEATGADAALIRLWNKNAATYPVIGQRGYPPGLIEQMAPNQSEGVVGWVMTQGEPIIAPNIATDSRLRGKGQLKFGFQSCAVLPLTIQGEVRGVIQLSSRTLGHFDEEQKAHFLAIGRQMSIALENRDMFFNLQTSRNELERANKIKDEFLSVMSHELRTPLSVVIGYSGMLREEQLGPLTKDQEQALEIIRRNSQELFAMIESIMDATKIETGSMVAEMDTVSPSQLLGELKHSYGFPNHKNIRFEWNFSEALPPLWTDLRKLRQILTNLINNAFKFTNEGSIVISAEERSEAEAGGHRRWVEFRVAESGIGIPPEDIEKIFERFHQVDSSETRSFEGVGLGLYIVKSFTEMLGGQVSVESIVGQGSTFTVTVPLRNVPKGGSTRPLPPPD